MSQKQEPFSSGLKKIAIFMLSLMGMIFLAEKAGIIRNEFVQFLIFIGSIAVAIFIDKKPDSDS